MSQFRVSPPRVFPEAERSSRPSNGAAGSADAYRQMAFVLGETMELVLDGLRLESSIASEAAGSRYRNVMVASFLATGSRAWLSRLQALHAVEWGAYVSAVPLIVAAAEGESACAVLMQEDAASWSHWLESDGLSDLHEAHATQYAWGDLPQSETIPDILADVCAAAGELAKPSPGATVLLAGGESSAGRLSVTFADRDFHTALAELTSGWLLALGIAKVDLLLDASEVLPVSDPDALRHWKNSALNELAVQRRCRMERQEIDGVERYVVENWRRSPTGAARRIVL
ncbi:MAG: hypothetical protein CL897_02895 [Dehalococcoidia bacterium]|nr:hypothetical protein [Dehalococcoidia bacterium]